MDNFFNKDPIELAAMCAQLKNSKIYQRVPLIMEFPEPKNLPEMNCEAEKKIDYDFRPLKTEPGPIFGKIPAFACQTHPDRKYWVTNGYIDKRVFLLREVDDDKTLSFIAQAELVPKVDKEYTQGKLLDDYYFKKNVISKKNWTM